MQFSPELRDGVAAGRITLSFRLWTRAQVKVGGQYATAGVRIEVDSMEMVPFSSVTPAEVRRMGEAELARIHAPIGLNLGSKTPAEIALAVLADILRIRSGIARDKL